MKELASDNRNTAAPRYSSGLLNLPSIFWAGHSVLRSGYNLKSASTIAVTMYPGDIVLTRMPCTPHSEARFFANCITPAFEALYAGQIRPFQSQHQPLNTYRDLEGDEQYPICSMSAHTCDDCDTASVSEFDHLFRYCLSGHKHTRDVHFKHHVCVLGSII